MTPAVKAEAETNSARLIEYLRETDLLTKIPSLREKLWKIRDEFLSDAITAVQKRKLSNLINQVKAKLLTELSEDELILSGFLEVLYLSDLKRENFLLPYHHSGAVITMFAACAWLMEECRNNIFSAERFDFINDLNERFKKDFIQTTESTEFHQLIRSLLDAEKYIESTIADNMNSLLDIAKDIPTTKDSFSDLLKNHIADVGKVPNLTELFKDDYSQYKKKKKKLLKFKVPPGTSWKDVTIQLDPSGLLRIIIRGEVHNCTMDDLGLSDGRDPNEEVPKNTPRTMYRLLKLYAAKQENHQLHVSNYSRYLLASEISILKRHVANLRSHLKKIIPIKDNPIANYSKELQWRPAKFKTKDNAPNENLAPTKMGINLKLSSDGDIAKKYFPNDPQVSPSTEYLLSNKKRERSPS